jgi:hypothetical protein
MGAFTAVEQTRIKEELRVALSESPTIIEVFTDGSDTYANNETNLKTLCDTVTAALFNQSPPTILP